MQNNKIENPLVDIILPNFNKANFIEECINSVINQTYKNWHLYLIDDHSTDNSLEIIDKFKNKKNISFIKLKKNKGPSFCRNLGIRISKAEYIAFSRKGKQDLISKVLLEDLKDLPHSQVWKK